MVNLKNVGLNLDDDDMNNINRAIDVLRQVSARMQDLVAKGQLTPTQYTTLLQSINGLLKSGDVKLTDINFNFGKITETMLADSLLQQMAGNTPVNATPADGSVTLQKMDSTLQGMITSFDDLLTTENESWVV